jgi:hypothetical protein
MVKGVVTGVGEAIRTAVEVGTSVRVFALLGWVQEASRINGIRRKTSFCRTRKSPGNE